MPSDVLVNVPGTEAAPLSYQLAPGFEIVLKAASARFDGSAAGSAFFPCLRITDGNGHLVGQYISDSSVAAGASADVSFAPFLSRGGASAAGGGIQFDTEPQSGDWLNVETTGADGVYGFGINLVAADAVHVQSTRNGYALEVDNTNTTGSLTQGIIVTVSTSGSVNGSSGDAAVHASIEAKGEPLAVFGKASGDSTFVNQVSKGGFLWGLANNGQKATGAQIRGSTVSNTTTQVIGVQAEAENANSSGTPAATVAGVTSLTQLYGAGTPPATGALLSKASPATGFLAQVSTIGQEATGIVLDVWSTSGTIYVLRAWANGTEIMRVDSSGNIHLRAGAGIVNDLP